MEEELGCNVVRSKLETPDEVMSKGKGRMKMNSKELLVMAKENAEKQLELVKQIENVENVLSSVKDGEICFFVRGYGSVLITDVTDTEKRDAVRELGLVAIMNFRDDKTMELEKLLGIRKPAIINPEFEAAVQGMVKPIVVKPKSKQAEDKQPIISPEDKLKLKEKLTQINKPVPKQVELVTKKPETKLGSMSLEDVTRMYLTENMTMQQIADHYGIKKGDVNNYIYLNHLSRKQTPKDDGFLDAKVEARQKTSGREQA